MSNFDELIQRYGISFENSQKIKNNIKYCHIFINLSKIILATEESGNDELKLDMNTALGFFMNVVTNETDSSELKNKIIDKIWLKCRFILSNKISTILEEINPRSLFSIICEMLKIIGENNIELHNNLNDLIFSVSADLILNQNEEKRQAIIVFAWMTMRLFIMKEIGDLTEYWQQDLINLL